MTGFHGGTWLWGYLRTSDIFKNGFPSIFKVMGVIFSTCLLVALIIGFFLTLVCLPAITISSASLMIPGLWFMLFYFLGYLITIWNPDERDVQQETKFQIEKKKSLIIIGIFFVVLIISLLTVHSLAFFGLLLTSLLFSVESMIILAEVGFTLAVLIWIHVLKTNLLKGSFLKKLKLLSMISFLPIIFLLAVGAFGMLVNSVIITRYFLLGLNVFLFWMFSYFVGLNLAMIKSENV
ncbi:MAG: hypothetical protein ACXQS8_01235 [Candidatus Helarchaeales archaeon]